ncbi:hypothetical protein KUTeg_012056 [Tegillarca granosa]|uniref:FYVE-type domain-containing protein n=1 Tax=Tegillarca granosa TaxID=220873 RepID=A0ABQ9EYE9_TEGGR|nr:hypothetical protein KUTeg_012056 [Tegillarca granosa]
MFNQYEQEEEGQRVWSQQVELAARKPDIKLDTDLEDKSNEITRQHWKRSDGCINCSNKTCKKKFSLIERQHHCRRCGEIFCSSCLQFRRKLNRLAHPDPDGKTYKVCQKCFEEGQDSEGKNRRLTEQFFLLRRQLKENATIIQNGLHTASWRSRLNIEKECVRLVEGFRTSVGTSEVKRTLHNIKTMLTTPDWQKSTFWLQENMTDQCQGCKKSFGLLIKKSNCKVCGKVVCKSCSSHDLLVYVDDDRDPDVPPQPKLAVIKIAGSPSKEPELSLYLCVCESCQTYLTDKQVDSLQESVFQSGTDAVEQLDILHKAAYKMQQKMNHQLSEYQIIVESLEDNTVKTDTGKNNIKVLAKSQEDLADYLSQFAIKIQHFRKLKPKTNKQAILFRNCLKSKWDYYMENMSTYRILRRKLSESAPPEVLEVIQRIVDKHAIVSAQLYIRQLVYETISLCDKYKIKESIPQLLTPVDEAIETDAQSCLLREGEDWDQHVTDMLEMIKTQIKDHRLVRPSRRLTKTHGF